MSSVAAALDAFRDQPAPLEVTPSNPFKLSSVLDQPATIAEIERAWPGRPLPSQLVEAWTTTRHARLFSDVEYGQWGLVLLSPASSAARTKRELRERPDQYQPTDLIVGEFLGDQELLVLAEGSGGATQVLIALPLDDRADWDIAAEDLGQFLEFYFEHGGNKYWEQRPGPSRH